MEILMQSVSSFVRFVLKLVLVAAAALFAASLLVLALVSVLWLVLKALLTGRKPAWLLVLQRLHQARKQFRTSSWRASTGAGDSPSSAHPVDVVDVEAFEVKRTPALGNNAGPEPR